MRDAVTPTLALRKSILGSLRPFELRLWSAAYDRLTSGRAVRGRTPRNKYGEPFWSAPDTFKGGWCVEQAHQPHRYRDNAKAPA